MIRNAKDLLKKVGCEDNEVYELHLDHERKFRYISGNVQIILTADVCMDEMIQGNKICLIRDCDYRVHNYFKYNNKTIFSNDMKYLIHALGGKNELNLEKQESEIQIVKYVLDTEVEDIENRNIEYKE